MRALHLPLAILALLIPLSAASVFALDSASAYQHIVNGGFEDGTTGWTTFSGQAALDAVDASVVPPVEGALAGRVVLADRLFSLRQSSRLGVVAGRYHFSARFRTDSPSVEAYAIIEATAPATGPVRVAGPSVVAGEWMAIEGDVDVPGGDNVAISIRGTGNVGDVIYFDDIRFEGAPPATMTRTATPTRTATSTPAADVTGTRTPAPSPTATPAVASVVGRDLVNGGFEELDAQGGILAWEKFGGSLSGATSPVRSGIRAARLESTTESTKWIHQPVLVEAGAWYHFDAWVQSADANVAAVFLRISWYESPDASGTSMGTVDSTTRLETPAAEYRLLSTGSVAAPPGARSARVRVMLAPASTQRATMYVDDAAFGPAEPLAAAPESAAGDDAAPESESVEAQTRAGISTRRPISRTEGAAFMRGGPSTSRVVINEVLYDDDGEASDAEGEWVELYNSGVTAVDLGGWTLRDNASVEVLPPLSIPPRGYAIIAASEAFRARYPDYSGPLAVAGGRLGNGLGNDGDSLRLADPSLVEVDAVSWGDDVAVFDRPVEDVPAGHSIERRAPGWDTNSPEDFVDNESPSPGRGIAATAERELRRTGNTTPPVEILAAEGSSIDAFLYGALAASGMALAGAVAWRAAPFVRERLRGRA